MTPSARLQAAIEVLTDLIDRRRPAADALKDWGLTHRFAGSGDRAAISALVHDALRVRAEAAFVMGQETPRAILIGSLTVIGGQTAQDIAALCDGARHAPAPLTPEEKAALLAAPEARADAPDHIRGNAPDWLMPSLRAALGPGLMEELQALSTRAPIDIRVNGLASSRESIRPELAHLEPEETPWSPWGLRFHQGKTRKGPALQAQPGFVKGLYEIQDEGSQIVALLTGAEPGEQVVDLCAGGGGKTLALAAMMNNSGQIFATDSDARRLAPIHERLKRGHVRNTQVRTPKGRDDEPLADLAGQIDRVVIDAPCTGTGTWRRNPDAKWRIRPGALEQRMKEQQTVLARAATLVKPGGEIAYITCSVLAEENGGQVAAFLESHPGFAIVPPQEVLELAPDGLAERRDLITPDGLGLQLTPHRTGTDGFFIARLRRNPR